MKREMSVGLFVLFALVIVGYMTIKVGGGTSFAGGKTYFVTVNSALGIKNKTPVLIAGYQAGVVDKISLDGTRHARLQLSIQKDVHLTEGTQAAVRAKGALGETFVEVVPGPDGAPELPDKADLIYNGSGGDINSLVQRLNDMTPGASRAVDNLDKFAEVLKGLMLRNEQNVNRILANFAALSEDLRYGFANFRPDMQESAERIASITRKVDEGKGTIGKLVNDDTTVKKINEAVDGINGVVGGVHRMQADIGFHTEYLGTVRDFKNYVHLDLKPRPDQAFLLEFVTNPSPPPSVSTTNSTVTVGGAATTVSTVNSVTQRNKFLVSAELAKKFYNWRLRGGIIESRGGVGLDYMNGPVSAGSSVWDFGSNDGRKPQVKVYGNLNLTRSIYLTGGGNDLLNSTQSRSWFVGGGVKVSDDDVKGVIGLGSSAVSK
jgi:phospholipid/cholesterol/gamma-HCH transport system substrate-binding protein